MKLGFSIFWFLLLAGCSTTGCSTLKKTQYSFFIAGHAYGNPDEGKNNVGLYKPFLNKINFINSQKTMQKGFLLGDVVWGQNFWKRTKEDIQKFEMPIDIVRGNHDGSLEYFENNFGKSYKKFFINNDLFILLDLNLDHWNITNEQYDFFKETVLVDGKKANNIFILSHQVLWYTNGEYSKPKPNSTHDIAPVTNYWSTIEPLLTTIKKPIYVFAGDVGAFSKERRKIDYVCEYSYFKNNDITYVTSGMGGGVRDNIVIIDVLNNGEVNFRLVHLNGDNINGLGKLEDYPYPIND